MGQNVELTNGDTVAVLNSQGLISITDAASGIRLDLVRDGWSMIVDDHQLKSEDTKPSPPVKTDGAHASYDYQMSGYRIRVTYSLEAHWKFVAKQIHVLQSPGAQLSVNRVVPWELMVGNPITGDFVPSAYVPQFGKSIEQSRKSLPGKDFGEFLRLSRDEGVMLVVQNPYLEVERNRQSVTIGYVPEMEWRQEWGTFASDIAVIGAYHLSGRRLAREMVKEWQIPPLQAPQDGMDESEVAAFTDCVRAFLINPSPAPISVEVGWTLNDYQIDVGTKQGQDEYRKIIDTASALGIETLLYGPANSKLADRTQSVDSWGWEYVLWLNMGEKIRKGEWDPVKDPVPASVTEMVAYAGQKGVGLLAYVYPSIPFSANPAWLAKGSEAGDDRFSYATLASRELQDYLIRNLVAFQRRTGIAGYSFDYTWLNLRGSSSYAQWYGWRRVMEALRRAVPSIVIDGRQSYQQFGPWSWLAGSYPHPTGNDEQPESFKPYPDLHFDRVSADRTRFVNYWYRNYQFAPEEVIPGYATHQTERSRNLPRVDGHGFDVEMMYSRYKPRDWDYLGYQYSFLSSIATAGWNNVVDMIPARDPEELRWFSSEDQAWIRNWLNWTAKHKEYLLHTRTILDQPAMGHVDGTAAVVEDRGYLFLFNPNYKQEPAEFALDEAIGLTKGEKLLLKEVYPENGRLLGKPGAGAWTRGDTVHLVLDGTSATVLEVSPEPAVKEPVLLNAAQLHATVSPRVTVKGNTLSVEHAAGEPGTTQTLGVLLPGETNISGMIVNGSRVKFKQSGCYVETKLSFKELRFGQAQEISVAPNPDGSLHGTFTVPQRVLDQLAMRKAKWPIPWTQEDLESTWLAPERLLLFVQIAEGNDAIEVIGSLDGQPLKLRPAYSSGRVDVDSFVGFYADLSQIRPDVSHTIELRLPKSMPGSLQGIFFDNVMPQFTESIEPSN
jgi:hypothetical protein